MLTIFLALGAWRISQKQVLTRRVPAIETLGVGHGAVRGQDRHADAEPDVGAAASVADGAVLRRRRRDAQRRCPRRSTSWSSSHPRQPAAIRSTRWRRRSGSSASSYLAQTEHLHDDWTLVREYPLSQQLLALSHVWKSPDGGDYVIAAKGAPEAIADLCHFDDAAARSELAHAHRAMADDGLRVLGVAQGARSGEAALPGEQHDFDFEFLGLIGLADPVRPTVPAAIARVLRRPASAS